MFELKNATMIYDMDKEEKVYAMRNINLQFPDKGRVGIIGPSGSGKSTMMYTMSTMKNLTSGEILYNGVGNLGMNPTFDDVVREVLEVHLFGCNENLYGHILETAFCRFLRNERRFPLSFHVLQILP